jgi:hypothetical protein
MKKFLTLSLLICSTAFAQDDQLILNGGVGVFHSGDKGLSETKMATLGVQEDIWGPLKDRVVVGGFIDNSGDGKSGSAIISGQLGFEVNRDGLVAGIFSGPTLISNPDILLGGNFQFMEDLHLGIQDKDSNYIGIFYRHISSAGLEMPNIGRDFVGLELRW